MTKNTLFASELVQTGKNKFQRILLVSYPTLGEYVVQSEYIEIIVKGVTLDVDMIKNHANGTYMTDYDQACARYMSRVADLKATNTLRK